MELVKPCFLLSFLKHSLIPVIRLSLYAPPTVPVFSAAWALSDTAVVAYFAFFGTGFVYNVLLRYDSTAVAALKW